MVTPVNKKCPPSMESKDFTSFSQQIAITPMPESAEPTSTNLFFLGSIPISNRSERPALKNAQFCVHWSPGTFLYLGLKQPGREAEVKNMCSSTETPPCIFITSIQIILPLLLYTGLFISPSGISELDCATTKTDTAERSI